MIVYVYILDTLADWEVGHIFSELHSGRFLKEGACVEIQTVACTKNPIRTMGGVQITPDCLVDEMVASEKNMLLLPGAETWGDASHLPIIKKAKELLDGNGTVAAICGAATALANYGLLDNRIHTSNGPGFLELIFPEYRGQQYYVDSPSVTEGNLITASTTGSLLWTKQIIERLGVFHLETLDAWYHYFRTGEPQYFYSLMESVKRKEI